MINQRLFDWYKIDTNKNLGIRNHCPRPFDTILIDKNGSCYACECTAWLPQSIGNLQIKTLDEIICSPMHEHLQESILDGTYRYCNENQCSYIRANIVDHATTSVTYIEHLRLAIDDSCNLRCPSCRTGLIFEKEGSRFNKRIEFADKINVWLQNVIHPCTVHIGSDGDPFASHVYRYFMEHTPDSDQIRYSILTNGLLVDEFHNKIPHVVKRLTKLGVSVDGATKNTYEQLRLGGSWEKIQYNLNFIKELKQQFNFKFELHMVVQKDNWKEMPTMLELADQFNVDIVYFNEIKDWNTGQDIKEVRPPGDSNEYNNIIKQVNQHPKAKTWALL